MTTILDKIFDHKKEAVEEARRRLSLPTLKLKIRDQKPVRDVGKALTRKETGPSRIIAEIKRRSPFKGDLVGNFNAMQIARVYSENGAAAISILTEERHFGGSLDFLSEAREIVSVPLLRKDFIFAEYQVYESRAFGADMFLLIATFLEKNHLAELLALGREIGLVALVETHHEKDLERAFMAGADLIGINNRDLTTGKTDLGISRRLLKMAVSDPANIVICESGIRSREEIQELEQLGAHAFLVGESLMTSENVPEQLKKLVGDAQSSVPS